MSSLKPLSAEIRAFLSFEVISPALLQLGTPASCIMADTNFSGKSVRIMSKVVFEGAADISRKSLRSSFFSSRAGLKSILTVYLPSVILSIREEALRVRGPPIP